jgi:hypothetical protein
MNTVGTYTPPRPVCYGGPSLNEIDWMQVRSAIWNLQSKRTDLDYHHCLTRPFYLACPASAADCCEFSTQEGQERSTRWAHYPNGHIWSLLPSSSTKTLVAVDLWCDALTHFSFFSLVMSTPSTAHIHFFSGHANTKWWIFILLHSTTTTYPLLLISHSPMTARQWSLIRIQNRKPLQKPYAFSCIVIIPAEGARQPQHITIHNQTILVRQKPNQPQE